MKMKLLILTLFQFVLSFDDLDILGEYYLMQKDSLQPRFTEKSNADCAAFNNCSGNGTCKDGVCECFNGFEYFDCSIDLRLDSCSSKCKNGSCEV